jgi:PAS domain S-box-containing protein/putative nucleotidyltransferase with HDIG domain
MKKILAIDDIKENLIVIKETIEEFMSDCLVATAQTGKDGLRIAKTEQPDTILLDIIMPEMDGYQVCKILKEDELTKHIPVIMLSAVRTDTESRIHGLDVGADAFLSKPVETEELIAQINVMLRIKEAEDKLREEREKLDDKVKERTKELEESEEKYRNIIDNSPDIQYRTDINGHIIFISPSILRITGYTAEEALTMKITDVYLVPKDIDKFTAILQKNGYVDNFETQFKHKDGSILWTLTNAHFFKDKNGKILGVEGITRDITERKQAEKIQKVLFNISKQVTLSQDYKELLNSIVEYLSEILDITNIYLGLYDQETDTFILPIFKDEKEKFSNIPNGKTLSRYVINTGNSVLLKEHDIRKLAKEGTIDLFGAIPKVWMGVPLKVGNSIFGIVAVQNYNDPETYTEKDLEILTFTSGEISVAIKHKQAEGERDENLKKLRKTLNDIVIALTSTLEIRDPYTAGHQKRVAKLSCAIAKELGLNNEKVECTRIAALLHDIGKIYIPSEILSKPGEISPLEYEMIMTHPDGGYNILKEIDFPWPVAKVVRQHHERLDGSGYPDGLKGDEILFEARILAVADVVEAMDSPRPYRSTLGILKALKEIDDNKGILYEEEIVRACVNLFKSKKFDYFM